MKNGFVCVQCYSFESHILDQDGSGVRIMVLRRIKMAELLECSAAFALYSDKPCSIMG